MDQIKIGKFIAESRKKVNLTQMQLAEMLGITDRAISKWETGKAMPDSSIMLELCDILKINVTDLLSGEVVTQDNLDKETSNRMIEIVKSKESTDRYLLVLEWVIALLSLTILFAPIIIALVIPMEEWKGTIVALSGFIPAIIGLFFALRIEQIAGYYRCSLCGHKYVPTFTAINVSMHLGRTRYMKCPECGKRSWQKKVISKGDAND